MWCCGHTVVVKVQRSRPGRCFIQWSTYLTSMRTWIWSPRTHGLKKMHDDTHLYPQHWRIRDRKIPRGSWPASPTELVSSMLSERLCLKKWGGEQSRKSLVITVHTHTHACTRTHVHTHHLHRCIIIHVHTYYPHFLHFLECSWIYKSLFLKIRLVAI